MAAWLAFLKSKLLLPKEPGKEEQATGEELAARLAFRLKRLDAMRNAAGRPHDPPPARPRRVRARHAGGRAHHPRAQVYGMIFDLLKAYADQRKRTVKRVHVVPRRTVWSIKEARQRLESLSASGADEWVELEKFLEQYGTCQISPARRWQARSGPRWRWRAMG